MKKQHNQPNQCKHNLYLMQNDRHFGIKHQNNIVLVNLLNNIYNIKYILYIKGM
jgi:hypothetical protein